MHWADARRRETNSGTAAVQQGSTRIGWSASHMLVPRKRWRVVVRDDSSERVVATTRSFDEAMAVLASIE